MTSFGSAFALSVSGGFVKRSTWLRGCVLAAAGLLLIPVSVDSITMSSESIIQRCWRADTMLRFKEVKTDAEAVEVRFTIANQRILAAAETTFDQEGHFCIVTAGRDGRHKRTSKHYDNQALDFRTWHLSGQPNPCLSWDQCSETCKNIVKGLRMRLGRDFDVLFEPDAYDAEGHQNRWQHIHIEFDPKEV